MATKELRDIYGGNLRQAIARAIRAEITDGDQILKNESNALLRLQNAGGAGYAHAKAQYDAARAARLAAENAIRAKYGLKIRGD